MKRYGVTECPICKVRISSNGLAVSSHMRAHVRRGEACAVTYRLNGKRKTRYEPTNTERGLL